MKALTGTSKVALAVAVLLASLSLVAWRQKESLDTLQHLETLQEEYSVELANREELKSKILHLESRARVMEEAEERLGMRQAVSSEIVLLPQETQ